MRRSPRPKRRTTGRGPGGKLALVCLRDVRRPAALLWNLIRWADVFAEVRAAPNGAAAVAAVLKYIAAACRRLPEEEIRKVMAQLTASNEAEGTEGTLGDQLREYFWEDGLTQGRRDVLLRQMRMRFGELPEHVTARVKAADRAALEGWLDRILTASSLDEVWGER